MFPTDQLILPQLNVWRSLGQYYMVLNVRESDVIENIIVSDCEIDL